VSKVLVVMMGLLPWLASARDYCNPIKVNGAENWLPFYLHNLDGGYRGVMGDVLELAALNKEVKLDFQAAIPWKRVLLQLRKDQIDIVAGAVKTNYRDRYFSFSPQILTTPLGLYRHRDNPLGYRRFSDLDELSGGYVRGMSLGQAFDDYAFENLILDDITSPDSLFQMIRNRRLDYGIYYAAAAPRYLEDDAAREDVALEVSNFSELGIFFMFNRKGRCKTVVKTLMAEIARLKHEGQMEEILRQYRSPGRALEVEISYE